MTTIEQLQAELSERHKLLVRYQKVFLVLGRAGVSPNTYNDAVTGKSSVLVPTMDRILTAQNQGKSAGLNSSRWKTGKSPAATSKP